MKPLNQLTATEIVRAIATGTTTCEAVTRACLEHIDEREPRVQAWQYLDPDLALSQARVLDQHGARGPLHGVPIGIKDIIDTDDMPTEYGTPIHEGHRPRVDAACVALTRRAGGVIMGKTVTTEFANFHPGKTMNPLDPSRTPGGSSSGSAAAVGDFMVPLAIGTQTTASTIRPAAFCGCVGYRPTYGDLRCWGVMEASGSLDTLGLIARSIDDVALYRAKAGARVEDVTLPQEFDGIPDAHRWISSFEFARNRAWEIDHHWEMISERLRKGRINDGLTCSFERYRDARAYAERCRLQMDDLFADYDVLLTPAAAGEAPLGLDATGDASFCLIWTTMHVPAMTLPLFTGPNGLPVGAQLVAKRNADRALFDAARWVTRAAA
jgi:Asp-tRNA(Asn)/Glu-tRNA(Gln) amidotransferase A subunit family amidase